MNRVNVSGDAKVLMCAKMREITERRTASVVGMVATALLSTRACNDTAFDTQQHDFVEPTTLTQRANRAAIEQMFLIARCKETAAQLELTLDRCAETMHRTKLERAFDIYKRMTAAGNARKEIISTIMEQLHMTKAGAASYYGQARNKFGDA